MYMKDNNMLMDTTNFSFTGGLPAGDVDVTSPDTGSDADTGPSSVRKMDLAACHLGKYMQDDSMEMLGNTLTINGEA